MLILSNIFKQGHFLSKVSKEKLYDICIILQTVILKKVAEMDIGALRTNYNDKSHVLLEEHITAKQPYHLFTKWFKEAASNTAVVEPNAMCLATATKEGMPSARIVLCKEFDENGFKFFTHYTSRKGQEIEQNPYAALTFYWAPLSKAVRIEGTVEKLPMSEAEQYFSGRPYLSQIGALCSDQSKPIAGRHVLANEEKALKAKYGEGQVPKPEFWGGYKVIPKSMEFWQGQTDRIHDRIKFRKPECGEEPDNVLTHPGIDGWIFERLAP